MYRTNKFFQAFLILVILISSSGCGFWHHASPAKILEKSPGVTELRTELIFGMSKKDGATVSETEWKNFLNEVVTPRFPEGFTVLDGYGQYKDRAGGISKENSKVILIVHPADNDISAKLEEIRDAYKKQFNQESVLRITTVSKTSF